MLYECTKVNDLHRNDIGARAGLIARDVMVALRLISFRIEHFFYQDLNYFLSSSAIPKR